MKKIILMIAMLILMSSVASAADICDSGDETTTCYVSSSHTIVNGTLYELNDLVIQTGGMLTTNDLDIFSITADNITIQTGGSINGNVDIISNYMQIESGASIDVDGKGYAGGDGTNDYGDHFDGYGPGGGDGIDQKGGGGGAGYGGIGGSGKYTSSTAGYGSLTSPDDFGSGGGSVWETPGPDGAGKVLLNIQEDLQIEGVITANGEDGSRGNHYKKSSGGGSGGTVYIDSTSISGNGNITANGGAGGDYTYDGGGGAGGRIAIIYNTNEFTGKILSIGGDGHSEEDGENGTMYLKQIVYNVTKNGWDANYDLTDENGNPIEENTSKRTLQIRNEGIKKIEFRINQSVNLSNLIIDSDSSRTVVSGLDTASGVTGTHSLYVPITEATGVYVCPHAETLSETVPGCQDEGSFIYSECDGATPKTIGGDTVTCEIVSGDYKVSGLTGSSTGETKEEDSTESVPEFSTIGMVLAVLIAIAGIALIVKKRR